MLMFLVISGSDLARWHWRYCAPSSRGSAGITPTPRPLSWASCLSCRSIVTSPPRSSAQSSAKLSPSSTNTTPLARCRTGRGSSGNCQIGEWGRKWYYTDFLPFKYFSRTLKQLRPTDRLRPTLPRICEESDGGQRPGSRGLAAMARLRSASECSLESVESDSDGGFKPGQSAECSDTESDIEMEVSVMIVMMTWAGVISHVQAGVSSPHVRQRGWMFESHPEAVSPPLPISWPAPPFPLG